MEEGVVRSRFGHFRSFLEVCVVVFVTHVVPFFDKSHFLITVAGLSRNMIVTSAFNVRLILLLLFIVRLSFSVLILVIVSVFSLSSFLILVVLVVLGFASVTRAV